MSILGLTVLILLAVVVLLAAAVLFAKVRLVLNICKPKDDKCICDMHISLFGGRTVKHINFTHPKDQKNDESYCEEESHSQKGFVQKIKDYYNKFVKIKYVWHKSKKKIRKTILCERLVLNLSFGLDDAAQTGIATGAVWAGVYNVISFLSNFASLREPEIKINPVFDDECVEFDGQCIIAFRIVNIISTLITVGINYYFVNKKLTEKEKAAISYGNTN